MSSVAETDHDLRAIVRRLGLRLKPEQYLACLYLAAHGKKFCVDFGYENAVEKARAHWRARRKK